MAQCYSNPRRESDPWALPDLETFQVGCRDRDACPLCQEEPATPGEHRRDHTGWYWWSCLPGCLPDGEAFGPFATEAKALDDARTGNDDDEAEPEP